MTVTTSRRSLPRLTFCKSEQFHFAPNLCYSPGDVLRLKRATRVGVVVPRHQLLIQIDNELVQASQSLRFWRDQVLLLDGTEYEVAAKQLAKQREAEIRHLLEVQESLQPRRQAPPDLQHPHSGQP